MKNALSKFNERMTKEFGPGSVLTSSDLRAYDVIPTGSLALDYALGVGGYPMGRIVEVWGAEGIGKTFMAILALKEAQKAYPDKAVAFLDVEHTFDLHHAEGLGLDTSPDRFAILSPRAAEEVADMLRNAIQEGVFSMIVLDSIGAMIPQKEIEKGSDEAVVALQAKIVTRMVKVATAELAKNPAVVMLINQVRANVSAYGAATTTGGGFALKHASTMKLKLKRTGTPPYSVKDEDGDKLPVGHEIAILVERNKVAPGGREATVGIFSVASDEFGPKGVDRALEAAHIGLKKSVGVIERSGAWYTFLPTEERFQGQEALVEYLRANPSQIEEVRRAAIASLSHEVDIEALSRTEEEIEGDDGG